MNNYSSPISNPQVDPKQQGDHYLKMLFLRSAVNQQPGPVDNFYVNNDQTQMQPPPNRGNCYSFEVIHKIYLFIFSFLGYSMQPPHNPSSDMKMMQTDISMNNHPQHQSLNPHQGPPTNSQIHHPNQLMNNHTNYNQFMPSPDYEGMINHFFIGGYLKFNRVCRSNETV